MQNVQAASLNIFVFKKSLNINLKKTLSASSVHLRRRLPVRQLKLSAQQVHVKSFRRISTSTQLGIGYKIKENLRDCYSLLNVSEGCSLEELRDAYFKMAKMYHPDSNSTTSDPKKFDQVKEAYKAIKLKLQEDNVRGQYVNDDDEDDEFDFKRPQPQHRQYLENEGIGIGTSSQRQKQYNQYRASKAQSAVFNYKVKKLTPEGDESALAVIKDQRAARRAKMSKTIDRLVEDMIQESMSKGDFDNLPGAGKPHKFNSESPYMDTMTQKLNQILIDSGLQPEWIMLQKEIRLDMQTCRQKLAIELTRLENSQPSKNQLKTRNFHIEQFETEIKDVNRKIDKLNMIVPILAKQMVHYSCNRESDKVCKNIQEYMPSDFDVVSDMKMLSYQIYTVNDKQIWKQIWMDLKQILRLN